MPSTQTVSANLDALSYAIGMLLGKVTATVRSVASTESPWVFLSRCSESSTAATICPKELSHKDGNGVACILVSGRCDAIRAQVAMRLRLDRVQAV
jgi:hypothetical protein